MMEISSMREKNYRINHQYKMDYGILVQFNPIALCTLHIVDKSAVHIFSGPYMLLLCTMLSACSLLLIHSLPFSQYITEDNTRTLFKNKNGTLLNLSRQQMNH